MIVVGFCCKGKGDSWKHHLSNFNFTFYEGRGTLYFDEKVFL